LYVASGGEAPVDAHVESLLYALQNVSSEGCIWVVLKANSPGLPIERGYYLVRHAGVGKNCRAWWLSRDMRSCV